MQTSYDPPSDYCLLCCNSGFIHDPGCQNDPAPMRADDIHDLCPGGPIPEGATCAVCNMSWQTYHRLLAMWALGAHECRPKQPCVWPDEQTDETGCGGNFMETAPSQWRYCPFCGNPMAGG